MDGLRSGPRFGLWWRVFSEDDEFSLWPRDTAAMSLTLIVPVAALLAIVSPETYPFLTIPVLSVMLHVFATYLTGTIGCVLTGPALVFGVGTLGWVMGLTGMALRPEPPFMLSGFALTTYLTVTLVVSLRRLWKEGRADFIALTIMGILVGLAGYYYGGQAASGFIGIAFVKLAEAVDGTTVIGVFNGCFIAVLLVSAGLALLYLSRLASSIAGVAFLKRKVVFELVALLVGCAPIVAAALMPAPSPAVACAVVVGTLVLLAFVAGVVGARVESWTLVAFLVLATIGIARHANVDATLPYVGFRYLYIFVSTNPLSVMLSDAALVVLDALTAPVAGLARSVVAAVTALGQDQVSRDTLQMFLLYPALVLIASLMGVASFAGEFLRERRRRAQREALGR